MCKPVYMKEKLYGKKWDKVKAKLIKMSQKKLAKVAKKAPCLDVRYAAVEKLTDQAVLAEIAKKDSDEDVRKAAVEKLTDQAALAEVAKNGDYWYDRIAAVEKLTDQAVLAEIAKKDSDEYVRRAAVKKLTDQALLADIAKNDPVDLVCEAAADKIPVDELIRLLESDPEGFCKMVVLRSVSKRKPNWMKDIPESLMNCILKYLQSIKLRQDERQDIYLIGAVIAVYRYGLFKEQIDSCASKIKTHAKIETHGDVWCAGFNHADHTTRSEYLSDRL